MQVGAFDEVVRPPDDFSQRIARNTQLVLQKECNLDQVIDPAGGSWYVEGLTAELANRAWALFQEVEKLGGMEAALRAGFPQKAVGRHGRRDASRPSPAAAIPSSASTNTPIPRRSPWKVRQSMPKRSTSAASSKSPPTALRMEDAESEIGPAKNWPRSSRPKAADLFEACVEAAIAGATLGEITRAMRINDSPCAPDHPGLHHPRGVPIERLRAAIERYIAGGKPASRSLPLQHGTACASTRPARISPAASSQSAATR